MKFMLASLKTLTNSKDCSESRNIFLLLLSFALIGEFSPEYSTFMPKTISRSQAVSGNSLESQAGNGKQYSNKLPVEGLPELFSESVD